MTDSRKADASQTSDAAATAILLKHYEAVRDEILERIRLRQLVLVLYLAFAATVLGFTVRDEHRIGNVVPLVTFGVAWIVRDHELLLSRLGQWLRTEYQAYLDRRSDLPDIPVWDNSEALRTYFSRGLVSRFVGYGSVFLILSIAGLMVSWADRPGLSLTVVSSVATLGTLVIILWTYEERKGGALQNSRQGNDGQ